MKARRPAPMMEVFEALYTRWGAQHWWPARTDMEMIVGAILTQNTAWTNVERAIARLRREKALSVRVIHHTPAERLAEWIRPAGYFNIKARRLRAFTALVVEQYGGSLRRLFRLPTLPLREALLSVNGIGPETADSILLYAAKRPAFVVDAYTRRVLSRHGWISPRATYDETAAFMCAHIPPGVELYNEYHALIVRLCKEHCKTRPDCSSCPLKQFNPVL
ncbi:MAG: endonuclease III domain-containing protein [Spartobacteria bacterium]|nr:endonuclease III domain-containing protein [Spartobacteria bacterium]